MKLYRTGNAAEAIELSVTAAAEESTIVYISDIVMVVSGLYAQVDEAYIRESGIMHWHIAHNGGGTVLFPGDISIMEYRRGSSDTGERVINALARMLCARGVRSHAEGNDLIADGRKTASFARGVPTVGGAPAPGGIVTSETLTQTTLHISMNIDRELIERVCQKPMLKIPGSLSELNVPRDDILKCIEEILEGE